MDKKDEKAKAEKAKSDWFILTDGGTAPYLPPKSYKKGTLAAHLVDVMKKHGKDPGRVLHVGSTDGDLSLGWREFALGPGKVMLPKKFWRRPQTVVAVDLVVIGDGWWISRVPRTIAKFIYIEPPSYSPTADGFTFAVGKQKQLTKQQEESRVKTRRTGRKAGRNAFTSAWGFRHGGRRPRRVLRYD